MAGVPAAITQAPLRTVRPRDLAGTYTQPSVHLLRLEKQGRVLKVAHGYYVAVPDDATPAWLPTIEDVAAGVATAIYGERVPVLMHLTAARVFGLLPRAIGVAIVAVPRQHDPIDLAGDRPGRLLFVERDVERLDAVLRPIALGQMLVTSAEQTVLDLARRKHLGGLPGEADDAMRALLPRCDPDRLQELADGQRMKATLRRVRQAADADERRS